jgi:kynurenine formamidase
MKEVATVLNAVRQTEIVDLSQTLEEHIPHFPSHSKFFHNLWGSYWHGVGRDAAKYAAPLKITDGSGSPIRALAMV